MPGPTTICPFCGKTVRAKSNTFDHHSSSGRVTCPLSMAGVRALLYRLSEGMTLLSHSLTLPKENPHG